MTRCMSLRSRGISFAFDVFIYFFRFYHFGAISSLKGGFHISVNKLGTEIKMDFIEELEENIMQDKKLYKSRTDKKLCGVCGGIAYYLGVDATAIRLAWCLLNCVYGIGVIAYIVAALVIPVEPGE